MHRIIPQVFPGEGLRLETTVVWAALAAVGAVIWAMLRNQDDPVARVARALVVLGATLMSLAALSMLLKYAGHWTAPVMLGGVAIVWGVAAAAYFRGWSRRLLYLAAVGCAVLALAWTTYRVLPHPVALQLNGITFPGAVQFNTPTGDRVAVEQVVEALDGHVDVTGANALAIYLNGKTYPVQDEVAVPSDGPATISLTSFMKIMLEAYPDLYMEVNAFKVELKVP